MNLFNFVMGLKSTDESENWEGSSHFDNYSSGFLDAVTG